ncbi:glycerol channel [Elasticomyces elasticus]|nr:glycerol channel [Elasticomyces elasticus]
MTALSKSSEDWSRSMSSEPTHVELDSSSGAPLRDEPTAPDIEHTEDSGLHFTPSGRLTKTSTTLQNTRAFLGLHPEAPIDEEHDMAEHSDLWWSKMKITLREPLLEFFGVFILVLFGDGSVAQVLLSTGQQSAPGGNGFGSYQSINWGPCGVVENKSLGHARARAMEQTKPETDEQTVADRYFRWGIGVMLGVYVAGDSGAYLNPAVTFTMCLFRRLPWRRFPAYFLAQFLGGFFAAGVVYANYINGINQVEGYGKRTVPPSKTATAGIFCTYPQAFVTKTSQFFSEFIASAILMFVIFALKDDSNNGSSKGGGNWFPLSLFFLVFGIGACFGWETGYAINLARDFGPRLMSHAVGYGHEVWSAGGYYFWVPMVAPFCGCVFGGFLYDAFLYTGPSAVNTPWFGLRDLIRPKKAIAERVEKHREAGLV